MASFAITNTAGRTPPEDIGREMAITLSDSCECRGGCGAAEDKGQGSGGGEGLAATRRAGGTAGPPESRVPGVAGQGRGRPIPCRCPPCTASAGSGGGRGRPREGGRERWHCGGRRRRLRHVRRHGSRILPRLPEAERGRGGGAPMPPPLPLCRLRGGRRRGFLPRLRARQHQNRPRGLLITPSPYHHLSSPKARHINCRPNSKRIKRKLSHIEYYTSRLFSVPFCNFSK